MKSFEVKNFLDYKDFDKIKKFTNDIIENKSKYSCDFGKFYSFFKLPEDLEALILNKVKKHLNSDDLEIIYCQAVKYQILNNCIPSLNLHKDNLFCDYTIDILLDKTIDWPLVVNEQEFGNDINSAIFLKGDEDTHFRPSYPSRNESDFILVIFINVIDKEDKKNKEFLKIFSLSKEIKESILYKMSPTYY